MNHAARQKAIRTVERLLQEGYFVPHMMELYRSAYDMGAFSAQFSKWKMGCQFLIDMLGQPAAPYKKTFTYDMGRGSEMLGALQALDTAIREDLFHPIEDLARADVVGDFLEQADYFLSKNYLIPAGVLGRAVLEDYLRARCERATCTPVLSKGKKPTISDYCDALYKQGAVSLPDKNYIQAWAAVGNNAAHVKRELNRDEVEQMLSGVRKFLADNPLS